VEHAARLGWELQPDFDALGPVLARARLCVSPLVHASGIQTKVLEAAAHGVAQVLDPVAVAGMQPGFPALAPTNDFGMVDAIVGLLDDDARRAALGRDAQAHMREHYSPDAWVPWARSVLAPAGG
jgi:hypothetical protein